LTLNADYIDWSVCEMGLFERVARAFRANVNSWVQTQEDPEKILEQAVMEMQDNLVQLRQAVAQAIATQKRSERQAAQAQSTADEWYRRAQLALQQNNEILAREALTKRRAYQETATALLNQIEQQKSVVAKLKKDIQTVEPKVAEAKAKKDIYIARARSAEASTRLQEMLGGVSTTSSLSAFERMEEKVMQLEAQSEAITKLDGDDLEKKFASLEQGGTIDTELAALKAKMLAGGENTTEVSRQLPKSQD
jgi:phage shock protein A